MRIIINNKKQYLTIFHKYNDVQSTIIIKIK